jgi:alpha-beta hydrolase superfamily lysophospholipase
MRKAGVPLDRHYVHARGDRSSAHGVMVLRPALVLAAAVIVAFAVGSGTGAAHACVKSDELWFRAADGTKLVGHRFGGKRPGSRTALVLAHMSVGDLCQWVPFARNLASKGVFVFPFDLRGHGFSEGSQNHAKAATDLVAAVRAVRSLGARRVIVGGASLGGIAALVAAPKLRPAVQGVVAVSAPAAIAGSLNALPAVRQISVPTLYVVAEQDRNPPYDFAADAQRLYDVTGTATKRLEVVGGFLHGTFLVERSAAVRSLLLAFARDPRAAVR